MTISNPVWENSYKLWEALNVVFTLLTAIYLILLGHANVFVGDFEDPDAQDLKDMVFWSLQFLPIVCAFVPGFPILWPFGYYLV